MEVGEEGLQQALARVKAQARQVLASEAAGEAEGQEAPELQLLRESLVEVLGPEDGVHLASFIRSDTLPLGELDMGLEEEEEAGEGEEEAPGGSAQLREVESELMRILEDLDTLDQPAAADGGAAGEVEDEDEDQGLEEQEEGEQDAGEELDESWVLAEDEEEVQQRAEEYVAGVKRMDAELLRLYGRWVIGAAQLEDVVGDIQQLGEALQLPDRVSVAERGGGCGGRGLDPSGRRGRRRGACVAVCFPRVTWGCSIGRRALGMDSVLCAGMVSASTDSMWLVSSYSMPDDWLSDSPRHAAHQLRTPVHRLRRLAELPCADLCVVCCYCVCFAPCRAGALRGAAVRTCGGRWPDGLRVPAAAR